MYTIDDFDMANTGMSLNSMSRAYVVLGAAKWTTWPSNDNSMSLHGKMAGV